MTEVSVSYSLRAGYANDWTLTGNYVIQSIICGIVSLCFIHNMLLNDLVPGYTFTLDDAKSGELDPYFWIYSPDRLGIHQ